jgi:hypothetical protein
MEEPVQGAAPVSEPPAELLRSQSRAVTTIGILNIAFCVVYVLLGVSGLFMAPRLLKQAQEMAKGPLFVTQFAASILVNWIVFLGLLISGILLLRRLAAGRLLLRIAAGVLALYLALDLGVAVISAVFTPAQRAAFTWVTVLTALLGTGMRLTYPLIATLVLSPSAERLGLK